MGIEVKRAGVRRAQCSCSMPAVWWALSYARGALVIFHSPRSCAHVVREKDVGTFHRMVGAETYAPPSPVPLLTSGIGEDDAVFGAVERLRACVRALCCREISSACGLYRRIVRERHHRR